MQTSNTITTLLLLPSSGNYLLATCLPSYSSTNNTFIVKEKKNQTEKKNSPHQLRRNYFPYLPKGQYKQEKNNALDNLQPFSIT
jgi:hypothetical protein